MCAEKARSRVPARSRSRTRDLRLSVRIKAKPVEVYRVLTSARELCRWWLTGAETDARNSGRLRMVWPKRPGCRSFSGEREGCFVDLEAGRKVAWLWRTGSRKNGVPPLCSFFILPQRRGCEVTLLHAGFPAPDGRGTRPTPASRRAGRTPWPSSSSTWRPADLQAGSPHPGGPQDPPQAPQIAPPPRT